MHWVRRESQRAHKAGCARVLGAAQVAEVLKDLLGCKKHNQTHDSVQSQVHDVEAPRGQAVQVVVQAERQHSQRPELRKGKKGDETFFVARKTVESLRWASSGKKGKDRPRTDLCERLCDMTRPQKSFTNRDARVLFVVFAMTSTLATIEAPSSYTKPPLSIS